jgi:ATP dependent DNA ligase-like protein
MVFAHCAGIRRSPVDKPQRRAVQIEAIRRPLRPTAQLPIQDAILDGELVCLDADGRSMFMELMRRRQDACYYAFDLIWLNGVDLRPLPLLDRKHLRGAAVELFRVCLRAGPRRRRDQGWARTLQRDASLVA